MKRRDFIKSALASGAALSVSGIDPFLSLLAAAELPDLVVARGSQPAQVTRAAVFALGGMRRFVAKNDVVVVKPNIGWDRPPELAANTNPEVVAAVVALCLEAGARKVQVFDRTVNNARRCYKQSGIADAASAAGAEVSFVDEKRFVEVQIGGLALKSWPIYEDIMEADKVINIPIAKHHGLASLTLGMKNLMGVMGGWRGRIHQKLDESIVDLAKTVKPVLTIIDAVRILTANGPQGGNPADVRTLNTVIAGGDPVATDSYGATLFGLRGSDLPYLALAEKAGLGTRDLRRIKIREVNV